MKKISKKILTTILCASMLLGSVELTNFFNNKFIAEEINDESLEELETTEQETIVIEEIENSEIFEELETTDENSVIENVEEIITDIEVTTTSSASDSITLDSEGNPVNPMMRAAITQGTVTYTYSSNKLTITGSGTVTNGWQTYNDTWSEYVTQVKSVVFKSTDLTGCDIDAFDGCTALTNVCFSQYNNGKINTTAFRGNTTITTLSLSNSNITSICAYAFEGCTALTNIRNANQNYSCDKCSTTKNAHSTSSCTGTITDHRYKLSASITTIGSYAFANCTALAKFNTNTGLQLLNAYAFAGCTSLNTLTVGKNVSYIGSDAFKDAPLTSKITFNAQYLNLYCDVFVDKQTPIISLGSSVEYIPRDFIKGNKAVTSITIPSSVKEIGAYAFYGCSGLTSVSISGSNITDIGEYAFYGCSQLTSKSAFDFAAFDESLTGTVGKYAFKFGGLSEIGTSAGKPTVSISQSVAQTTNYYPNTGIAKVTMNIIADSTQAIEGSDYIICLDVTASMDDADFCDICGKCSSSTSHNITGCTGTIKNQWTIAKEAACNFVRTTINDNNKNRVALITYTALANDSNGYDTIGVVNVDFTSDLDVLVNKINNLSLGNTRNGGATLQTFDTSGGTNYRVGLIASAKLAQARGGATQTANNFSFGNVGGADRPINLVFISDGEPNANNSYILPASKICKGLFDNIWSLGICVSSTVSESEIETALGYLKYINTTLNGEELFLDIPVMDMEAKFNEFLESVTWSSKASIYDTRLTSTIDTNNWEFYTGADYPWSSGVKYTGSTAYVDIDTVDDDSKSYYYYVRLKNSYRSAIPSAGTHTPIVLKQLDAAWKISGGQYANEEDNISKAYSNTLPWYAYNVIYNGNGNTSGNTLNQVKVGGINLALRSNGFAKTGYGFTGWNTKADGTGTAYAAGTTYSTNSALTLYAQWDPIIYIITYNGSGATSGSTASQTKSYGESINISENGFVRTGYEFTGWKDINGNAYKPGDTYSTNANLTLYAQWKLAKIDVPVTITWVDKDNEYASRPKQVALRLMNGTKVVKEAKIVTGNNSSPASTNAWTYKFEGVDIYDSNGKEIQYTVVEGAYKKDGTFVADFVTFSNGAVEYKIPAYGGDNFGLTVVNELRPIKPEEEDPTKDYGVTISGTVTWKDENDKYHFRPDSVIVELYQDGKLYDTIELTDGTTDYKFTGLSMIDSNFKKYTYTIKEKDIDNYVITYKSDSKTTAVEDDYGNTVTTTTYTVDITNTFTPDKKTERFSDNQLTLQATFLSENGNAAIESDFKKVQLDKEDVNTTIVLKQLNLSWEPVNTDEGKYNETYSGYSGNEINLILHGTDRTYVNFIPYGKYEIAVQNNNNFAIKDIEELATENVVFSYEDGKYYVTYSYQYEEAKEDLNVNMTLNSWRGYTSKTGINNFFKKE